MKSRTVYPVPDRYLTDQPAVEHECDHKDCVASGAFTEDPPPKAASKTKTPDEPGSSDSENRS